jgi:hypothetical protein
MSPQDSDAPQTEREPETETKMDSEAKQQQITVTDSREQEIMSPVTKESNEDQTKVLSSTVQFKSEEKRTSVPILESEHRQSHIHVKRKGSEGQTKRDGYEEERCRPDEIQSSDESGNEFVTLEHKVVTSSRSASITTTNVIQVKQDICKHFETELCVVMMTVLDIVHHLKLILWD